MQQYGGYAKHLSLKMRVAKRVVSLDGLWLDDGEKEVA